MNAELVAFWQFVAYLIGNRIYLLDMLDERDIILRTGPDRTGPDRGVG